MLCKHMCNGILRRVAQDDRGEYPYTGRKQRINERMDEEPTGHKPYICQARGIYNNNNENRTSINRYTNTEREREHWSYYGRCRCLHIR